MKDNGSVLKKTWLKSTAVVFLTISVFLIYLAPYWMFEESSRSSSLIRITLFLASIFLLSFYSVQDNAVNQWRLKIAPLNLLLTVLFVYLFINAFLLSSDLQPARRLLLLVFVFLPFLFLELNVQFIRKVIMLIAVVIAVFAVYSLINQFFKGGLPTGYREGELFSSGTVGIASFRNTIVAAMHYAIGVTILTYLLFTESKRILLWFWTVLLVFIVLYIILTFARSAWVACLVAAFVIYSLTFEKSKIRFYVAPIFLLLILLYFSVNFIDYEFGERGMTHRDDIWRVVVSRIEGHWIFGYGLSTPFEPIPVQGVVVGNSHNVYLEIVYEVGLIGLLLYLFSLFAAVFTLFKSYLINIYSDLSVLFLALLVAVSVVMLTELNSWIHTPNLLWMWLWVPIAVSLSFERKLHITMDQK